MFSEREINEFLKEEFKSVWGHIVDPSMDSYGPKLHEEFDIQEWQRLRQTVLPMPEVYNWTEPTCLRVKKTLSGYKADYYSSWGDDDLEEMSRQAFKAPEILDQAKTRIQITLKRNGRNVRGHSGNFVIRNLRVLDVYKMLSRLNKTYPKITKPSQVVRIQLTEYSADGSYRPQCGKNFNLHEADLATIVSFVSARFSINPVSRKRIQKAQVISRDMTKLPSAVNIPYGDVHHGLWCLCRIRRGSSWVLSISDNVDGVIEKQQKINQFTYILNPSGSIYRNCNG